MLILNRKVGESITIGDDIEVEVLSIRGQVVTFIVRTPDDDSVDLREAWQAKPPAYDPGKKCGKQLDTEA